MLVIRLSRIHIGSAQYRARGGNIYIYIFVLDITYLFIVVGKYLISRVNIQLYILLCIYVRYLCGCIDFGVRGIYSHTVGWSRMG